MSTVLPWRSRALRSGLPEESPPLGPSASLRRAGKSPRVAASTSPRVSAPRPRPAPSLERPSDPLAAEKSGCALAAELEALPCSAPPPANPWPIADLMDIAFESMLGLDAKDPALVVLAASLPRLRNTELADSALPRTGASCLPRPVTIPEELPLFFSRLGAGSPAMTHSLLAGAGVASVERGRRETGAGQLAHVAAIERPRCAN
mmetsp:Transcript_117100/g.309381  ORF Transcript_117100/g.309381 Transcript_117100/m.309381 type:complete len:205 (+) Transcript_117100:254-868(+)